MSSSLTPSIQAGQRLAAASAAPPAPVAEAALPVEAAPPAIPLRPEPPRPLLRRVGRRALRLFRPLAAPLLNRMDLRIRWAVDRSETAEALRQGNHLSRTLADEARRADARLDALSGAIGQLAAQMEALSSRLGTLDLKLGAARLDMADAGRAARTDAEARGRAHAALLDQGAALSDRLATLSYQGTALAAQAAAQGALVEGIRRHLDEAGSAWLDQRLAERLDDMRQRHEAALLGAEERTAARLQPLQESATVLQAQSSQLVGATDLLRQRRAISLGPEFAVRTDAGYLFAGVEDTRLLLAVAETCGRLEPGTLAVLAALLPEGGVLLDVGANIGTIALPAARRVGPRGRVLALEPAPRNAALLRRTVALNELEGIIEVQEVAAGDVEGTAPFHLSAHAGHHSLVAPGDTLQTIEVPLRPLDALVPPGSRVDVVKVDVEGAELQVWRGMRRIVADNPELAVVLEFGPEHLRRAGVTVAGWFDELREAGHAAWEIDEASGAVRPLRETGLGDVFSFNILLLRDPPASRGLRVA